MGIEIRNGSIHLINQNDAKPLPGQTQLLKSHCYQTSGHTICHNLPNERKGQDLSTDFLYVQVG